jgi:nucleoid-associated protein YejK
MKKKLITLAKELDFNSETEYFDYCIESYFNGNIAQCMNLFDAMRKENQKSFLRHIKQHDFEDVEKIYNFYFNLL